MLPVFAIIIKEESPIKFPNGFVSESRIVAV